VEKDTFVTSASARVLIPSLIRFNSSLKLYTKTKRFSPEPALSKNPQSTQYLNEPVVYLRKKAVTEYFGSKDV